MPDALFYGNGTALITPFIGDEVDLGGWERLIEAQIEGGADALVVLGSTGEGPAVTFEERQKLVSVAVSAAGGRLPVIVCCSSNCTRHAALLAANAAELGADGVLVSPPGYNKPTSEGIMLHFAKTADAGGIPLIIYNIPGRTGVDLPVSLIAEMARHPLIRGLKEASTDAGHIALVMSELSEGIAVYAGNDALTLPIMAAGGRGVISVAGNLAPREMALLTRAMLREDLEAARSVNARLNPLFQALACEVNPVPVKYAMSRVGMCEDILRLPLMPIHREARERVDDAMRALFRGN